MRVFYNPSLRDHKTGGLAVIPKGSDGGRVIKAMIACRSHPARVIKCEDVVWFDGIKLSEHINRFHCRVTDSGAIIVLPRECWPKVVQL